MAIKKYALRSFHFGCLILLLPFLFSSLLFGQNRIQEAIDKVANDPSLKHASWGVAVVDVETGQVIASHQPELSLVPGSALKVLTTSTALALLGPDYRFETAIQYDGSLKAQ